MFNILIIYGSTTGNCENLSYFCKDILTENTNIEVNVFNCIDINKQEFNKNNIDLYILCCSTWGIDPAVLQEDFYNFFATLSIEDIQNKKFAIIAMGDNYYPYFAESANILSSILKKNKGVVIKSPIKIQDPWESQKDQITTYLKKLLPTC